MCFSSFPVGFQMFQRSLEVIDFAKEFFEASHPRLSVQQGDGLSALLPELDVLLVDVDFLRSAVPPRLLEPSFWRRFPCAAVNALGASDEALRAVAAAAEAALVLKATGQRWSSWRPRPAVLLLGDMELLRAVEVVAQEPQPWPWLERLVSELRRELWEGSLVTQWLGACEVHHLARDLQLLRGEDGSTKGCREMSREDRSWHQETRLEAVSEELQQGALREKELVAELGQLKRSVEGAEVTDSSKKRPERSI